MKSDVLSVEGIIESGYRKVRKNGTVKFRHALWKDERFLVGETVFCRFQGIESRSKIRRKGLNHEQAYSRSIC